MLVCSLFGTVLMSSTLTLAVPGPMTPILEAAPLERSRILLPWNGPRSLTLTMTDLLFSRLVTLRKLGNGRFLWAAV